MNPAQAFETVTDWIVAAVMALVLGVLYAGWIASYLTPKAAPIGTSIWFRLPAWGQIAAGLAISAVGAYGCYLLWIPLPLSVSALVALALRVTGLPVLFGGALIFLWARHTLGVMYGASTSTAVQLHAHHRLIQHGPYALVRHPIYLGYWLILAGLLIVYRTWMPLLVLVAMMTALYKRARREEQALEATFGDTWRAYASRVPGYVPRWAGLRRTNHD